MLAGVGLSCILACRVGPGDFRQLLYPGRLQTEDMSRKQRKSAAAGQSALKPALKPVSTPPGDFGAEDPYKGIRYNRNTQLDNQRLALSLLDATEATLRERGLECVPSSYFLALWPLVDNREKEEAGKMGSGQAADFNTGIMYLISLVAPRLETSFIRSHYSAIYAKMPGAMSRFFTVSPFIRAATVVLQSVLGAFESEEWHERTSLAELFSILMQLVVDPRPKVRKLAQDALLSLVRSGVVSATHPAKADMVSFVLGVLQRASRREPGDALHLIPLLRSLLPRITLEEFSSLSDALLRASSLGHTHLTVSVYSFLASCFDRIIEGVQTEELLAPTSLERIITALDGQRPEISLVGVAPHWMNVLVKAFIVGDKRFRLENDKIVSLFKMLFSFLVSPEEVILQAVQESLRLTFHLVRDEALGAFICSQIGSHLMVKHSSAAPAMIQSAADYCQEVGIEILPTASELVVLLAQMHDSKQTKHAALIEKTLGVFVAQCGVEEILRLVPLNLVPEQGRTPRAWMLPMLKENVSHARLEYFVKELVPLAENMSMKSAEYSKVGKDNDAKVYNIIYSQIWATLSAFLFCPVDFVSVFPSLAPVLGKVLNSQPQLRPTIANALAAMIGRCRSLEMDIEQTAGEELCARAAADLQCLAQFSGNFIPILFNIYGVTEAEQRGYLLSCIEAFLSITPVDMVKDYLHKVRSRLAMDASPVELVSFLELCTVLVRTQQEEEYEQLMRATLPLISHPNVTVQKRAYRVIGDLLCREDFVPDLAALEEQLLAVYEEARLDSAAKKGRFRVLSKIIGRLPDDFLHWIPLFLPEIILGTKEMNQQARLEAFELLLAFARRMTRGGMIMAERTRGMLTSDTAADLNEFMTMLMAGLAGTTPHMISATILSLARVLFEMRLGLDRNMLHILLGDIIAVLRSPSREVVKAALGFIKVALVSLKDSAGTDQAEDSKGSSGEKGVLEAHLAELIPNLLNWSSEHHQHFKLRVRHIMERLVRRFGFEHVWKLTPIEHQKLLTNIRKTRERLKRQQKQGKAAEGGDDDHLDAEDGGTRRDHELEALTSAALSKATVLTRNTSAAFLRPSRQFESALNDSESEYGSASEEELEIPGDSILNDLANLEDDEEIENVLSRKLSLATSLAQARNSRAKSLKRTAQQRDSEDEDGDGGAVRVDADGLLHFSDEEVDNRGQMRESDDDDDDDDDDDENDDNDNDAKKRGSHGNAPLPKRVRFGKASLERTDKSSLRRKNAKRGDARRKGEKFEPFSYLPMTRATKKGGAVGRKTKKTKEAAVTAATPKYYMKRS